MTPAREWAELLHRFRPGMNGNQTEEEFLSAFAAMIALIQEDAGAPHDEAQAGTCRRAVEAKP